MITQHFKNEKCLWNVQHSISTLIIQSIIGFYYVVYNMVFCTYVFKSDKSIVSTHVGSAFSSPYVAFL